MISQSVLSTKVDENILRVVNVGSKIITIHATTIRSNNLIIASNCSSSSSSTSSTSLNIALAAHYNCSQRVTACCINETVTVWKNGVVMCHLTNGVQDCCQMSFLDPVSSSKEFGPTLILASTSGLLSKYLYTNYSSESGEKMQLVCTYQTGRSITRLSAAPRSRLLVAFADGSCSVFDDALELLAEMRTTLQNDPAVACCCNLNMYEQKISFIGIAHRSGLIRVWSSSTLFRSNEQVFGSNRTESEKHEKFIESPFATEIVDQCMTTGMYNNNNNNRATLPTGMKVVGEAHHGGVQTDLVFLPGCCCLFATSGRLCIKLWTTLQISSGRGLQLISCITISCIPTNITITVNRMENSQEMCRLVAGVGDTLHHIDVDTRSTHVSTPFPGFGTVPFDYDWTKNSLPRAESKTQKPGRRIKNLVSSGRVEPMPPFQPVSGGRSKGKSPRSGAHLSHFQSQSQSQSQSKRQNQEVHVVQTQNTSMDISAKKQLTSRQHEISKGKGRSRRKDRRKSRKKQNSMVKKTNTNRLYYPTKRTAKGLAQTAPPTWVKMETFAQIGDDEPKGWINVDNRTTGGMTPGEWQLPNKKQVTWETM